MSDLEKAALVWLETKEAIWKHHIPESIVDDMQDDERTSYRFKEWNLKIENNKAENLLNDEIRKLKK